MRAMYLGSMAHKLHNPPVMTMVSIVSQLSQLVGVGVLVWR